MQGVRESERTELNGLQVAGMRALHRKVLAGSGVIALSRQGNERRGRRKRESTTIGICLSAIEVKQTLV